MADRVAVSTPMLDEVRGRRDRLGDVVLDLQQTIADPESPLPVADVRAAVTEHIEDTEAENGILDEARRQAPRLGTLLDELCGEHRELDRLVGELSVESSTALLQELHDAVQAHLARGGDLLYELYDVDLGAGG